MAFSYADNIDAAEAEFEEFNYSYTILDSGGDVRALCCDEESAKQIVDALNKEAT